MKHEERSSDNREKGQKIPEVKETQKPARTGDREPTKEDSRAADKRRD